MRAVVYDNLMRGAKGMWAAVYALRARKIFRNLAILSRVAEIDAFRKMDNNKHKNEIWKCKHMFLVKGNIKH